MSKKIYTKKESFGITWEKLGILALLCMVGLCYPLSWKKFVICVVLLIFVIYMVWEIWQTREVLQRRKKHQICLATQTPQNQCIGHCPLLR